MSAKRRATTELNHDNWDQEDEKDKNDDETEEFKIASKDILEKRVIRVAKRRSKNPDFDVKKSVFSGFSGFNKEQKTSFDFLANLTNSSNTNNATSLFGTSDAKSPTPSSTSLFTLSGTNSNSPFTSLAQNNQPTVFGTPFNSNSGQSLFTSSKTDTPLKDSSPKTQINPTTNTDFSLKPSLSSSPLVSSPNQTIFGGNLDDSKSKALQTSNTNNTSPFKIQTTVNSQESSDSKKSESDSSKIDDVKLNYYSKLKGLNESVSKWIKQHVEKTPLCILTPIFKDYEKYIVEIQDEYEKGKEELKKATIESPKLNLSDSIKTPTTTSASVPTIFSDTGNFKSIFSQNTQNNIGTGLSSNFSFGANVSSTAATSVTNTQSTGFSFGIKSSPVGNTLTTTTAATTGTNGGTPFSFGIGKPFSFNSNVQTQKSEEPEKEDDTPPKVEYNPVVEENSVFDKKCKVFVKKDADFIDKGVGTLYIKKIDGSEKHQLLVRANTNLGNVLLNLILSSSLPTQRMGKNNVMMVCIPTPDFKPPPVPILIRVKTTEEADELLTTLDKYKT